MSGQGSIRIALPLLSERRRLQRALGTSNEATATRGRQGQRRRRKVGKWTDAGDPPEAKGGGTKAANWQ